MAFRRRMGKSASRRHFTKNARRVHRLNIPRLNRRGGIRL